MHQKINEPSNWLGIDMAASDRWSYRLSAADIAEIDAGLATSLD